jgi:hypothetical protein
MELKRLGGAYTPEFLSPQEYSRIINLENEPEQGMGQGSQKGMHQGDVQANSIDNPLGCQLQKGNGKRGSGHS